MAWWWMVMAGWCSANEVGALGAERLAEALQQTPPSPHCTLLVRRHGGRATGALGSLVVMVLRQEAWLIRAFCSVVQMINC